MVLLVACLVCACTTPRAASSGQSTVPAETPAEPAEPAKAKPPEQPVQPDELLALIDSLAVSDWPAPYVGGWREEQFELFEDSMFAAACPTGIALDDFGRIAASIELTQAMFAKYMAHSEESAIRGALLRLTTIQVMATACRCKFGLLTQGLEDEIRVLVERDLPAVVRATRALLPALPQRLVAASHAETPGVIALTRNMSEIIFRVSWLLTAQDRVRLRDNLRVVVSVAKPEHREYLEALAENSTYPLPARWQAYFAEVLEPIPLQPFEPEMPAEAPQ